jgi:hypothetical protein
MPPPHEPPDYSYYPAHMRPVSFPTAAAEAAKAACDRVAALLNEHLLARPQMVDGARDGWEGAFRVEFDETWSVQESRLNGLKEDLQRLSGSISTAMGNVATTNAQRATQRTNYLAEQNEAEAS